MASDWIKHVKQYAKENKCTFGEALKKAGPSFNKGASKSPSSSKSKKNRSRRNRKTRRGNK